MTDTRDEERKKFIVDPHPHLKYLCLPQLALLELLIYLFALQDPETSHTDAPHAVLFTVGLIADDPALGATPPLLSPLTHE